MIYTVVAALSFFAPPTALPSTRATSLTMLEQPTIGRREMFSLAAAAATMAPLSAVADGASSPAVLERSRQIYGSRVARLADASPEAIIEEKNAFTLFTTGAYPRTGNTASKETQKQLTALSKKAVAAATKGDKAGANAAVKEFIATGKIRELDTVQGGNFNPKQRRNPGAPPTSEIEAQMGPSAYALYQAKK
jgi:hypothetical protein